MKKTLIALASVAALGAAHADVTLYGVIDASFATVSAGGASDGNNPSNINSLNSYAAAGSGSLSGQQGLVGLTAPTSAGNGRVTSMANGLLQASRWGLKGTEDLGGGLKANFVLESGLNIAAGTNPNDHALLANATNPYYGSGDSTLNGQMFDRQSTVGLSGDFGQLDVGYQMNLTGEMTGLVDPFSGGAISPLGFYGGVASGAGSSFTGRASNSMKYAFSMGQTKVSAFYAMGGASGNAGQGSQAGLSANFQATPTVSFNLSASRMNDDVAFTSAPTGVTAGSTTSAGAITAPNSVVATASPMIPGLKATYFNSTENVLGIIWQATPTLQVKGGYLTETLSNPTNGAGDLNNTQVLGVPIVSTNNNPYGSNTTRTVAWVGGTYDITPMSHLTAAYYQETLGAYVANVKADASVQQTYSSNTAQIFAIAYKYDLSKKTDVYAAANYETWNSPGAATGGAAVSSTNTTAINQTTSAGTTQTMFAVGLRTKF